MSNIKQPLSDLCNYCVLFGASIFINKYVLSILKFSYPTIFQGWQTFIGAILLKCLIWSNYLQSDDLKLDKSGFISLLPSFLFFSAGIVASSKALANLSIPIFLCLQNTLSSALYLLEAIPRLRTEVALVGVIASIVTLMSATFAVFLEISMAFSESPYFWMVISLACMAVQTLHSKISDARYNDIDRLYFSYIFSVIILAPASLYLQEAFDVLKFENALRYDFYIGCVLSGIIGLFLNILLCKVRSQDSFVTFDACGKLTISLLSLVVFGDSTKHLQKAAVFVNLVAAVFVPSFPKPTSLGDEISPKNDISEDREQMIQEV